MGPSGVGSIMPSGQKRRPLPPADSRLGQLHDLLNVEVMAEVFAGTLDPATRISDLRVRSVAYRPGAACTVAYRASVGDRQYVVVANADSRRRAMGATRSPASMAAARAGGSRSIAASPLSYDARVRAVLQWYPVDLGLPVLARSALELRRLAGSASASAAEPETLMYRPGERAVLRLDGLILKAYADEVAFRAGVRGLCVARLADTRGSPPLRRAVPDVRLTVQTAVAGRPVEREQAVEFAPRAGALLRALHDAEVPSLSSVPPASPLAAATRSAALVVALAPPVAARVRALLARLRRDTPPTTPTVVSHGDFNVSQLLDVGDHLVVVDFDEVCRAAPALDVAAYAANLVSGRPGDLEHAFEALEATISGYGHRPEHLRWHLAATLLRRAPSPFRLQKKDWPDRIAAIVSAAEAVLESS
jgi:phosphotransferase family enzyme